MSPPAKATYTAARDSMRDKFKNQFFKTSMCAKFEVGQCRRGEHCKFAHSIEDIRSRPCLDKTKLCPKLEACVSHSCRFAHSREELVATSNFSKTKMCHFKDQCLAGDKCRYAHSIKELVAFNARPTAELVNGDKKPKKVNFFDDDPTEEHRDWASIPVSCAFTAERCSTITKSLSSSFKRMPSLKSNTNYTAFSSPFSFDIVTNYSRGSSIYGPQISYPQSDSAHLHRISTCSAAPTVTPTLMEMLGEPSMASVSGGTMMSRYQPSDAWTPMESTFTSHDVREDQEFFPAHTSAPDLPMHVGSMPAYTIPRDDLNARLLLLSNQFENPFTVPLMSLTPVASSSPEMIRNAAQ